MRGTREIGRRDALRVAGVGGGVLLLGFTIEPAQAGTATPIPDAFVRIAPDGRVTFVVPYAEMGQGAYTSQAQILAEELEVDPSTVTVEPAPPNEGIYASPIFGGQITGGSASLRGSWMTLRNAGAAARMMLVEAAARRWKVPAASCHAEAGKVLQTGTARALGYGALAAEAAALPVPASPALKSTARFRVVGRPVKRVDLPAKIDGTARFGIDARPPGVRHAMVRACPVLGGRLASVRSEQARAIKGVRQIVQLDDAVAVVADHTWAARKGLAALDLTWSEGGNAALSTADLVAAADAALERPGLVATRLGNVDHAEATAARRYEAVFRLPMLAHAAMEPLSCTAHVTRDGCEVWVGSQVAGRAQKAAADAAGVPLERVVLHNHLLGGGFGRRLETDYVTQAVRIAKQVEGPVKVTWSREEDMTHDYYRFHNHSRVTVGLDGQGRPVSWRHRVVGPNIMARFLPVYQKDNVDLDIVDDASGPYDIPNVLVDFTRNEAPAGVATGNWRGVGPTRNVFIVESVIDQLAHDAGRDPVAYRRAMMAKAPRSRAALDLAVARAGWKDPLPERHGRGVAVFSAFGSHVGTVAEVEVTRAGKVRVHRVVCAIDCGLAVNPDIVRAQIEGGVIFGISAVLHGRITIARGRVEQGNFDTYPVLRMHEAPKIEVHLVPSSETPGGVGEPGTSGAIAAVANAVFAATRKRITTLPIDPAALREA